MTLKRFGSKSTSRDWYEWLLVDLDTGRELDRGSANESTVANNEAWHALAAFERRLTPADRATLARPFLAGSGSSKGDAG